MANTLEQFKSITTIVADTGDIEAIKRYQPEDATTNPSLILKAAQIPAYGHLIENAIEWAKTQSDLIGLQIEYAGDKLSVNIGVEILKIIPGRISTEVDARLSFNKSGSINKAHQLIQLYKDAGIDKSRILIKLASTWEGICAAKELENEGINCNLTLLFSFSQARACAEAGVFLISPFVGRILDWYKKDTGLDYSATEDPGVVSVTEIYNYYKHHGFNTVVMGASFRNTCEIIELAGCDRLTIGPALLEEMANSQTQVIRKLIPATTRVEAGEPLTEAQFRWEFNEDPMAVEKLAEGIRNFAIDQGKLEVMLKEKITS